MNFLIGVAEEQFRSEVRAFLTEHLDTDCIDRARETGTYHDQAFAKELAARGWIGAAWPTSVGAVGMSPERFSVLWEELHYHGAPVDGIQLTEMVGHAILQVGSTEQRDRYLPPILAGEMVCCLGYSEPDAGSDLAACRTRADAVEGGYVINGAKIFTTLAHVSDQVFLLARTDPTAPKHKGLSMFLVPLSSPGIEIRPIETFGGERTNETVYQDVFVPESMRLGDENAGWAVVNIALDVERSIVGSYIGQASRLYDALAATLLAGETTVSPADLRRLALFRSHLAGARALCDRVYCRLARNQSVSLEAAMAKLYVTDLCKQLAHEALDLVGPPALAVHGDPLAAEEGLFEHAFRHAQILTIYAGSNEIQRNIIAAKGLGLPRG